jgi:hypothetical protein
MSTTFSKPSSRALAAFAALPTVEITLLAPYHGSGHSLRAGNDELRATATADEATFTLAN